jgi:RNA polymerase sigma-70 factor (ECF subfamily)
VLSQEGLRPSIAWNGMEGALSSSDHASLPFFLLRFGRFRGADIAIGKPGTAAPADDETLLLGVQSGDREALGLLFLRYSRSVLSVGRRILRDRAEAEDLVHDVFLFVLSKSALFDPAKGSARGWLARVAYHRALDRRKYLVRRYFYDAGDASESVPRVEELGHENGPEEVEFCYWQPYLQHAWEALADEQRRTLELHFFEGLTINEISERLGKSAANVRHYYYRGLECLRGQMFAAKLTKRAQP